MTEENNSEKEKRYFLHNFEAYSKSKFLIRRERHIRKIINDVIQTTEMEISGNAQKKEEKNCFSYPLTDVDDFHNTVYEIRMMMTFQMLRDVFFFKTRRVHVLMNHPVFVIC